MQNRDPSTIGFAAWKPLFRLLKSARRVRRRAYVSFDVQLGWLTICGSHGDQAGGA